MTVLNTIAFVLLALVLAFFASLTVLALFAGQPMLALLSVLALHSVGSACSWNIDDDEEEW